MFSEDATTASFMQALTVHTSPLFSTLPLFNTFNPSCQTYMTSVYNANKSVSTCNPPECKHSQITAEAMAFIRNHPGMKEADRTAWFHFLQQRAASQHEFNVPVETGRVIGARAVYATLSRRGIGRWKLQKMMPFSSPIPFIFPFYFHRIRLFEIIFVFTTFSWYSRSAGLCWGCFQSCRFLIQFEFSSILFIFAVRFWPFLWLCRSERCNPFFEN